MIEREIAPKENGTYLYAVVSGLSREQFGPIGISDSEVYTIKDERGELTAIVSDLAVTGELRPERRNLAAHQRVLNKAIEDSRVVLPVSFGTIADNPDGVRRLLARYQTDLSTQMRRVDGKVQIGARAYYRLEQPSVFEFFVKRSNDLARVRDAFLAMGPAPSRDAKIELGQTFEQVVGDAREELTAQLEGAVAPYCDEVKRNKPRNEQEMVRLACLVPKGKQREFEAALDKGARLLPEELAIEQIGPFPPYDFVELHLTP